MPMYEYQCAKCGETFEKLQKFSDAPIETHEGCGGAVEKLLSAPAFQFKGTGWYVTDYAKGSTAGPAVKPKEGSATTAATEAKVETKTESKPAAPAAKSE
jgi:putative FmdB family regulatory protein